MKGSNGTQAAGKYLNRQNLIEKKNSMAPDLRNVFPY